MNKQTEALTLALEALWTSAGPKAEEAIAAIKEAFAQPEQRPWVGMTDEDTHAIWNKDFRGWISRDSMEQITLAVASELKEKNT